MSSAVLPALCSVLGFLRGQEHFPGLRGPGAWSLPRPRPLPPLSSFPPSWPPSPFPLCLYFCSLTLLSPLPSRAVIVHLHTHTHTHTHIYTHPCTHTQYTHPYTHTPTHTLVWTSTNLGCPVPGSPLLWTRRTLSLLHSPPSSPSGFSLQSRSLAGEAHQELLSQGRHPHDAWESPVAPHEDCKPPGDTFEMS